MPEPIDAPDGLLAALAIEADFIARSRFDYLVRVATEDVVRGLAPYFRALRSLGVRGVIVTALANEASDYDFVSRFFAPGAGIDEDPVTGSAHCTLAPYWASELGRTKLRAYQASPRGGALECELIEGRVCLRGRATTVLSGDLLLAAIRA